MDESDLVRRGQAGDEGAFRALVEEHRKVLFGTAFLMTRDHGLAEDAVQEALIAMWRHLPSFRAEGSFKAWGTRIVVNEVKQQWRKKRAPVAPLEEAEEIGGDPDEAELPAFHREEHARMKEALETLPVEQKETVVLRYYADLPLAEIAKAMGCREGTVKSRLNRALGRLAVILGESERQRRVAQEG